MLESMEKSTSGRKIVMMTMVVGRRCCRLILLFCCWWWWWYSLADLNVQVLMMIKIWVWLKIFLFPFLCAFFFLFLSFLICFFLCFFKKISPFWYVFPCFFFFPYLSLFLFFLFKIYKLKIRWNVRERMKGYGYERGQKFDLWALVPYVRRGFYGWTKFWNNGDKIWALRIGECCESHNYSHTNQLRKDLIANKQIIYQ